MSVLTPLLATSLRSSQGKDIVIPDDISVIDDNAFRYHDIDSVVIPEGVTSIGKNAFQGTNLTSIVLPKSITSVGDHAFYGTQISSVTINCDSVYKTFGDYAFGDPYTGTSFELNFGDNVKTIGPWAFEGSPAKIKQSARMSLL